MGEGKPVHRRFGQGRLTIAGLDLSPLIRPDGLAPIIVTAMMGAADQRHFNVLRSAHYPPSRNQVAAHITLFHQLPPSCLAELDRLIKAVVADSPPQSMLIDVISLGRGTAFRIHSPDLLAIRARIADWFTGSLSVQDKGTPRLHITVQNKVTSIAARTLHATLAANFEARPLAITGLAAHHYRGGPWEIRVRTEIPQQSLTV